MIKTIITNAATLEEVFAKIDEIVRFAIKEELQKKQQEINLYSIHQTTKKLRIGNKKLKEYIADGIVKATPDNRISEYEINKFLGNE